MERSKGRNTKDRNKESKKKSKEKKTEVEVKPDNGKNTDVEIKTDREKNKADKKDKANVGAKENHVNKIESTKKSDTEEVDIKKKLDSEKTKDRRGKNSSSVSSTKEKSSKEQGTQIDKNLVSDKNTDSESKRKSGAGGKPGLDKKCEAKHFEWNSFAELHLLYALNGMKPIGPVYHFILVTVHERFCTAVGNYVPLEEVKNKLGTYYDFEAAKQILGEDEFEQEDFSLPENEFDLSPFKESTMKTPIYKKPKPPPNPKKSSAKRRLSVPAEEQRSSKRAKH